MKQIKILRYHTEFGDHYRRDNSNLFLVILADFLLIEVVCFGSLSWKRLINALEEDEDSTCGNLIDIEKRGQNLYLGYVHNNSDYPYKRLEISKEDLFELMIEWERLIKEKPEEIILIRNYPRFELVVKEITG